MNAKESYIAAFQKHIRRPGAASLLNWLLTTDFFEAPASTRFHGAYKGGLVDHSLNVYDCLNDYLSRERVKRVYGLDQISDETIAALEAGLPALYDYLSQAGIRMKVKMERAENGNDIPAVQCAASVWCIR